MDTDTTYNQTAEKYGLRLVPTMITLVLVLLGGLLLASAFDWPPALGGALAFVVWFVKYVTQGLMRSDRIRATRELAEDWEYYARDLHRQMEASQAKQAEASKQAELRFKQMLSERSEALSKAEASARSSEANRKLAEAKLERAQAGAAPLQAKLQQAQASATAAEARAADAEAKAKGLEADTVAMQARIKSLQARAAEAEANAHAAHLLEEVLGVSNIPSDLTTDTPLYDSICESITRWKRTCAGRTGGRSSKS